jgi:hypothetical protein
MEILIQTTKGEMQIDEATLQNENLDFIRHESSSWDGEIIINFIITLTPAAIGSLTTIIIQGIRARKHIKIIDNGVEIHGVSEKNIKEILETIYANKSKVK